MTTKIFLLRDGRRLRLKTPFDGDDHADVVGELCPECGSEVFAVQGGNMRPSEDDRAWEADGVSTCCKTPVGTIRAEVSTIFGVREDQAVLEHGRCRAY
jgi:hypothetical protein